MAQASSPAPSSAEIVRHAQGALGITAGAAAAAPSSWLLRQSEAAQQLLYAALEGRRRAVFVLDIEGTTTPLPFVTKTLFPAAERNYEAFLMQHFPSNATVVELARVAAATAAEQAGAGTELHAELRDAFAAFAGVPHPSAVPAAVVQRVRAAYLAVLRALTAANSKVAHFKTLQGLLWEELYARGALRGDVFDDAARAIRAWAGTPAHEVHIYSSGSVRAQRLLFANSTHGNMEGHFAGFHDTTTAGIKTDPASYAKIVDTVLTAGKGGAKTPRSDVGFVFVSDSIAEIAAAKAAGFDAVILCIRPLNMPLPSGSVLPDGAASICSFDQLLGYVSHTSLAAQRRLCAAAYSSSSSSCTSSGGGEGLKSFL